MIHVSSVRPALHCTTALLWRDGHWAGTCKTWFVTLLQALCTTGNLSLWTSSPDLWNKDSISCHIFSKYLLCLDCDFSVVFIFQCTGPPTVRTKTQLSLLMKSYFLLSVCKRQIFPMTSFSLLFFSSKEHQIQELKSHFMPKYHFSYGCILSKKCLWG